MQYTEEQLNRIRGDFYLFARNMFPEFEFYDFQKHIMQLIKTELLESNKKRASLFMSICPGAGKSFVVADLCIPYILAHNPTFRIGVCSYSTTIANILGRRARATMMKPQYQLLFPDIKIVSEGRSGSFELESGGTVACLGRGAGLTSRRFDVAIVDDLIANSQEAKSEKILNMIPDFLFSTFLSRLDLNTPKTFVLAVETTWCKRSSILLLHEAFPEVTYFNPPALCTDPENDLLGRKLGESIDERLISRQELLRLQKQNPYTFANLYQNEPINLNATYFQRADLDASFNLPTLPTNEKPITLVSIDSASVVSETSDYTVATYWLAYKDYWIIDKIDRFKKEITELSNYCSGIKADYILVEKASSGLQLLQLNSNLIPSLVFRSADDKENHAKALNVLLGNKIFIRKSGIGLTEEEELLQFPFGVHDDVPLSILHGYRYLINNSENLKAQKSRPKKRRAGSLLRRANNI